MAATSLDQFSCSLAFVLAHPPARERRASCRACGSAVRTVDPRLAWSCTLLGGHGRRLSVYATALGRQIALADRDVATLGLGALLHDVGKLAIPVDLLRKAGPLTVEEYDLVKEHTTVGDTLVSTIPSLLPIRSIVRSHHERLDGSGSPDGLRGETISLAAQIVGIADVYDALVTARPYKPAFSGEQAFDVLLEEVDQGWRRRDLVDEFVTIGRAGLLAVAPDAEPTGRGRS